jgi:hypothetical protein
LTYLDDIGAEISAKLSPEDLPEGDIAPLMRLYAVLALAKGCATTDEDVHNAWVAWMAAIDPTHDALRPFADLDRETRREDAPFLHAIKSVAASRGF